MKVWFVFYAYLYAAKIFVSRREPKPDSFLYL